MKDKSWQTLESETVFKSGRMRVLHNTFRRTDGVEDVYEIVDRPNFTIIIPKAGEMFYMVHQYRYAVDSWSLEFPAGTSNDGEDLEQCAHRELEEETGMKAVRLEFLGTLWTGPGGSSQSFNVYLAEELFSGEQNLDDAEYGLEIEQHTLDEIKALIKQNSIQDSNTIAAFGLYLTFADNNS